MTGDQGNPTYLLQDEDDVNVEKAGGADVIDEHTGSETDHTAGAAGALGH